MACSVTTELEIHDVIVVGAGFSGLYMAWRAREVLGLDVVGIEAGAGPGGTWYWNRYPGARCDSESFYYCYTFSEVLLEEWDWSSRYPEQPEILRYLEFVADRLDLRRSFRFDTRVDVGQLGRRQQPLDRRDRAPARRWPRRYVVTAVGCLSAANVPDIPGRDDFQGEWYHTGRWPHEGVDFRGKRVAQIGTGSTGIQAAPVIARRRRAPLRLPADAELHRPGPRPPDGSRGVARDQVRLRRGDPAHPRVLRRLPLHALDPLGPRGHRDGAQRGLRRAVGRGRLQVPLGWLLRHHVATRRPTTPRPSSSATRSARS